MTVGEAPKLDGRPFEPGDIVRRGGFEEAIVVYVSDTHDYAEVRYPDDGYVFRTRKSEWKS